MKQVFCTRQKKNKQVYLFFALVLVTLQRKDSNLKYLRNYVRQREGAIHSPCQRER